MSRVEGLICDACGRVLARPEEVEAAVRVDTFDLRYHLPAALGFATADRLPDHIDDVASLQVGGERAPAQVDFCTPQCQQSWLNNEWVRLVGVYMQRQEIAATLAAGPEPHETTAAGMEA